MPEEGQGQPETSSLSARSGCTCYTTLAQVQGIRAHQNEWSDGDRYWHVRLGGGRGDFQGHPEGTEAPEVVHRR